MSDFAHIVSNLHSLSLPFRKYDCIYFLMICLYRDLLYYVSELFILFLN